MGRVVLIGTPIGNLGDLSPRATAVLAAADVICCEDTRHTGRLLQAAGVTPRRLLPLHQHNEVTASARAVELASGGATVAVVTDAGMPGISDPGRRVVRGAVEAGIVVEVVPGPTAFVTAVVMSGFASERFCFEGFLPRKGGERASRLAEIAAEHRTVVLYEAPHRVARTVNDLESRCGPERQLVVARELTKLHEEVWRGTLGQAVDWVAAHPPRGEWVLVLAGAAVAAVEDDDIRRGLATNRQAGQDRRAAVASVAAGLGVAKRRVYQLALEADQDRAIQGGAGADCR